MSGPGGGPPIGPPIDPGTNCDELTFKTKLASPDASIVSKLKIGDVLNVQIHNKAIAVVHMAGVAGSIIENVPALLRCLQQDYKFMAVIEAISGGVVEIEVRPA